MVGEWLLQILNVRGTKVDIVEKRIRESGSNFLQRRQQRRSPLNSLLTVEKISLMRYFNHVPIAMKPLNPNSHKSIFLIITKNSDSRILLPLPRNSVRV